MNRFGMLDENVAADPNLSDGAKVLWAMIRMHGEVCFARQEVLGRLVGGRSAKRISELISSGASIISPRMAIPSLLAPPGFFAPVVCRARLRQGGGGEKPATYANGPNRDATQGGRRAAAPAGRRKTGAPRR